MQTNDPTILNLLNRALEGDLSASSLLANTWRVDHLTEGDVLGIALCLDGPPSTERWVTLCHLLNKLEIEKKLSDDLLTLLAYALSTWPGSLRSEHYSSALGFSKPCKWQCLELIPTRDLHLASPRIDGQQIVTCAMRLDNNWRWFTSDIEDFVLDQVSFRKETQDKNNPYSFNINTEAPYRYNLPFIDENNAALLMAHLRSAGRSTTKDELAYLLEIALQDPICYFGVMEVTPALCIDFDRHLFFSRFGGFPKVERYAPKHWQVQYALDFRHLFPVQERYWIVNDLDVLYSITPQSYSPPIND